MLLDMLVAVVLFHLIVALQHGPLLLEGGEFNRRGMPLLQQRFTAWLHHGQGMVDKDGWCTLAAAPLTSCCTWNLLACFWQDDNV